MLLDNGVRALFKVLEAYMDKQRGWLNPPKAERYDLHGRLPNVGV
jgi:hypothetical protein